jgi:hypothetical protein
VKTDLDVDFRGSNLNIDHHAHGSRTIELDGKSLAGNFWVGTRDEQGRWQMCPFEWFRKGQKNCRAGAATESGHLLKVCSRQGRSAYGQSAQPDCYGSLAMILRVQPAHFTNIVAKGRKCMGIEPT